MILNQDFREFIELLSSNHIKYFVVGGYALALYGYPRYIKDMDIWILIHPENAKNVLKALYEFGVFQLELSEQDFLTPGNVIIVGVSTTSD